MDYTLQNGSQADTVSSPQIAAPTINTDLFRTFDFNGANAFRVDSSRIVAKPVAPIIKTVPYVPEVYNPSAFANRCKVIIFVFVFALANHI